MHVRLCMLLLYLKLYTYSFLRLSNILPHSVSSFDSSRHLCVGDIIFADHYVVVIIKCPQTMQGRSKVTSIFITALGLATICPVSALISMLQTHHSPDDPLFQITTSRGRSPLTDSVARKHLKQISTMLNSRKILTFHDFRRAGATWAFR